MDNFDDNMQELFANLEAAATTQGFQVDGQAETTSQIEHSTADSQRATTPVGTPLQDAPPLLPLQAEQPTYSMSTTFHSGGANSDTILVSPDHVIFYVDSSVLLSASQNAFNCLLSPEAMGATAGPLHVVLVPEHSVLLNVMLHAIYSMSCSHYNPPLGTLLEAIPALKKYGIPEDHFIATSTPLFAHILAETPRNPVSVFLAAAENNLEHLAVASSAHLHSLELHKLTDEMADRMGSRYLQRLFRLHVERTEYLKRLLLDAPKGHEDTLKCGFVEQKRSTRAWALAAASLVWDIKPDMPASLLRSTLGSLEQQLECDACKASLTARIRQVVLDWLTNAKSTI
ncbi:hypothetical protein EIP91_001394 [Steccherinum ochraceum]|uniref:BTB domain-containing protein n=1 Tax=Steccherinum ochraceum TaxID=92696 RepID=A0A4R0RHY3_9APHY|nr:hypothetical protein EIP91_001394 [Steccherinum ochraceum]